jgi:hypothetical protein
LPDCLKASNVILNEKKNKDYIGLISDIVPDEIGKININLIASNDNLSIFKFEYFLTYFTKKELLTLSDEKKDFIYKNIRRDNNAIEKNNIIDNNIINNYNYTSVNEIPYTPPITITSTSYPTPTLQQSNYIPSINTYNNIFTNEKIEYSNAPLNSLNIQELIENQERIDELVKKTEPKKNIFQSSYVTGYNYNSDYQLNNRPYLYQTPSIYKTQSPLYYNFNQVNQVQYNKGIKYSLPTKYSVEPIKYNKPKIIYSSMTARRNFEGNKYKSSSRLFYNLFSKYGMNLK